MLGGAWLVGLEPVLEATRAYARSAAAGQVALETFTPREAADFDAFAARIMPTDDTPGAREAGVVYFADRALGSFLGDLLPMIQGGLADLAGRAGAVEPSAVGFADIGDEVQDGILREVEADPTGQFFFLGRILVMLGMFSDPALGGNRSQIGWRLLGFEDRFVFEPPFGYYDAEADGPER